MNAPQRQENGESASGKVVGDSKRKRVALQQGCSTSAGVGSSAGPLSMQPASMQVKEPKRGKKAAEQNSTRQVWSLDEL